MIVFAQQRSLDWGDLLDVLLSLGLLVIAVVVIALLLPRMRRRLLGEAKSGLEDDEFTLEQVRQFLRDGLITEEEAGVLKEKILARSRKRMAELDAQRDADRRSRS